MDLESFFQYFFVKHYTYTLYCIQTKIRHRSAFALASQRADDHSRDIPFTTVIPLPQLTCRAKKNLPPQTTINPLDE